MILHLKNERIAVRLYGPTLEANGEVSNGIDVRVKNAENLILDKWCKGENYHPDDREGQDYYKVGAIPGADGSAFWVNKKINKSI